MSTSVPNNLEVGQKLWYVPDRPRGPPTWVEIFRIGRKYVYVNKVGPWPTPFAIVKGGLHTPSGSYPEGRAYLSQEEYDEKASRDKAFHLFKQAISRCVYCPKEISAEDIRQAARLMGMPIERDAVAEINQRS